MVDEWTNFECSKPEQDGKFRLYWDGENYEVLNQPNNNALGKWHKINDSWCGYSIDFDPILWREIPRVYSASTKKVECDINNMEDFISFNNGSGNKCIHIGEKIVSIRKSSVDKVVEVTVKINSINLLFRVDKFLCQFNWIDTRDINTPITGNLIFK